MTSIKPTCFTFAHKSLNLWGSIQHCREAERVIEDETVNVSPTAHTPALAICLPVNPMFCR